MISILIQIVDKFESRTDSSVWHGYKFNGFSLHEEKDGTNSFSLIEVNMSWGNGTTEHPNKVIMETTVVGLYFLSLRCQFLMTFYHNLTPFCNFTIFFFFLFLMNDSEQEVHCLLSSEMILNVIDCKVINIVKERVVVWRYIIFSLHLILSFTFWHFIDDRHVL